MTVWNVRRECYKVIENQLDIAGLDKLTRLLNVLYDLQHFGLVTAMFWVVFDLGLNM